MRSDSRRTSATNARYEAACLPILAPSECYAFLRAVRPTPCLARPCTRRRKVRFCQVVPDPPHDTRARVFRAPDCRRFVPFSSPSQRAASNPPSLRLPLPEYMHPGRPKRAHPCRASCTPLFRRSVPPFGCRFRPFCEERAAGRWRRLPVMRVRRPLRLRRVGHRADFVIAAPPPALPTLHSVSALPAVGLPVVPAA